ncbi:MAG: alpha/beta hydrolase [Chloroflexota bacterium]
MTSAEILHEAIARLWDELPDLFGEAWDAVRARLLVLLRQLEREGESETDPETEALAALRAQAILSNDRDLDVHLHYGRFGEIGRGRGFGFQEQQYASADPSVLSGAAEAWLQSETSFPGGTLPRPRRSDRPTPSDLLHGLFAEHPAAERRLGDVEAALASQHAPRKRTHHRRWGAPGPASAPGPAGAPGPASAPARSVRHERYTTVPVLFGTTRQATADRRPERSFSGARGDGLHLGIAEVSIPDDHRLGDLEQPSWWRLEFRPDPAKHVVLLGVEQLDRTAFRERARAFAGQAEKREALIFVHGYNVNFATAIRQAAQVAYDLQFGGLAMAFTWPSEAKLSGYAIDEANARWTEPYFRQMLELCVSELELDTVHVVAHSMGNRVLTETIADAANIGGQPGQARLGQIVLAAPDVDAQTLVLLADRLNGRADRFTLYVSSRDKALLASQRLHRYPRAGDTRDGLCIVRGMDTIDASAVDTSFLGHSYFGAARSVISDIFALVRQGLAPDNRFGLKRQVYQNETYWVFHP